MSPIHSPSIVDQQARHRFTALTPNRGTRLDGYVDYVWKNDRLVIEAYAGSLAGKRALEFGCNIGATAIVLAHLGADVTAVDRNPRRLAIAEANATQYGKPIQFRHVSDTDTLPFADGSFDIITCCSVLEYMPPDLLNKRLADFDKALRPGGLLLVTATSNRLMPREVHSGRWLANYLPRKFKPSLQRGTTAWRITGQLPGYRDLARDDAGYYFLRAKRKIGAGGATMTLLRVINTAATVVGLSIGYFLPSIFLALRKPE